MNHGSGKPQMHSSTSAHSADGDCQDSRLQASVVRHGPPSSVTLGDLQLGADDDWPFDVSSMRSGSGGGMSTARLALRCLLSPCPTLAALCGVDTATMTSQDDPDGAVEEEALLLADENDARGIAGTSAEGNGQLERNRGRAGSSTTGSRGYDPPRAPRSHASGLSLEPILDEEGSGTDGGDYLSSATATSVTTPSAAALSPWCGEERSKDRWVMQRGVLVRIGADGVPREVTDSQTRRMGQQHRAARGGGSRFRTADVDDAGDELPPDEWRGGARTGGGCHASPDGTDMGGGDGAMTIVEELEALRSSVYSLEQLSLFLERCAAYLPVRVEVEACGAGSEGTASPYALHILGPVQATAHAQVLSVVEDVLLDDCDGAHIRLAAIHISDLVLSSTGGYTAAFVPQPPPPPDMFRLSPSPPLEHTGDGRNGTNSSPHTNGRGHGNVDERQRAPSNAFLDQLPALTVTPPGAEGAGGENGQRSGGLVDRPQHGTSPPARRPPILPPEAAKECETRVLVFIKNVLESESERLVTVHLTRCLISPLDLGKTVPLPLTHLRRLLFEQCPLTAAHVHALLTLARAVNRRLGGGAPVHGTGGSGAAGVATALTSVEELQLSGSLTEDAVVELLNYFSDEVEQHGQPALQTLRVPSLLVRATKAHPFLEPRPHIQVLPSH